MSRPTSTTIRWRILCSPSLAFMIRNVSKRFVTQLLVAMDPSIVGKLREKLRCSAMLAAGPQSGSSTRLLKMASMSLSISMDILEERGTRYSLPVQRRYRWPLWVLQERWVPSGVTICSPTIPLCHLIRFVHGAAISIWKILW
jgi:hypothetical protein